MENVSKHQSILTKEVIELLRPVTGQKYLDATFGGGGHTKALLTATEPNGEVIGIDRDPTVSRFAEVIKEDYPERFRFEPISYTEVESLNERFDGAILDLGMSSDQLESSGRGFSFQKKEEPLDLRFDDRIGQTAAQFLSQAPLSRIEQVFRNYAQDRYWRGLSAKIVRLRREQPIKTVGDFIRSVGNEDPKVLAPLFQGLRIEVNNELQILEHGLQAINDVLLPGGRMAVITFHSLEDRIVKDFFRSGEFEILTKKPIEPSMEEVRDNPRSRSAKLRVAIKK